MHGVDAGMLAQYVVMHPISCDVSPHPTHSAESRYQ
jgi:hypothetical protein